MNPCVARRTCRLCESGSLDEAFALEPTPVADAFVPNGRLEKQERFPLELVLCRACGHLQLRHTVDPVLLFRDYIYVSVSSPGLVEHFKAAAARLDAAAGAPPGSLAVDIGSNDGSLLRFIKERGWRVLGVDPARAIAQAATEAGVLTVPEFFSSVLAKRLRSEHGPAALVTANNVFAHSDALADMADGIRELLAPDGLFVFEVAALADMLDNFVYDSIYHEHLSYHSARPLESFLRRHGLELIDLERIAIKGGSLRLTAQLRGGPRQVNESVARLLAREDARGLGALETFRTYARLIAERKESFLKLVKDEGDLAGYGASPTVTTLLYHLGLGERLKFLVDDNPIKQGLMSPGHHIPVMTPQALYERKPRAVVLLAWRFADAIIAKHAAYLAQGGRFILPLPEPRVA